MSTQAPAARRPRWAMAMLWAMILAYAAYFSVLSVRLHDAQRTHKSDLGQMDQAIWNTNRGRFVQETKLEEVSARLTDHVEPIYAPVSLVFYLWDDVRALLVLQSVALALGAWPVYLIAEGRLATGRGHSDRQPGYRRTAVVAALACAAAYLLYPPLQAANVAEFHALPLATPLILLVFLAIERQRWAWFLVATVLVAMVQEGTALLAAALGAYALALGLWRRTRPPATAAAAPGAGGRPDMAAVVAGAAALLFGLGWFYVATFVIIPAYAAPAYGLEETPYAARFGALGDSFGQVALSMLTRPGLVLQVALEPLRVEYVWRLLAPVGFLALAGPEILLLAFPLFAANALSSYPMQYSGLLHYSAPLAAYAVMGAIVGGHRISAPLRRLALQGRSRSLWRLLRPYRPLVIWLLFWSIACQVAYGYTPVGRQFRYTWPEVTAHHRLLERFAAQVPAEVPLSTMSSLYPHFTHRQNIYQFPLLGDAEVVLLDLAATTGWSSHPTVVRDKVRQMLQSGQWAVQDAADGYLLLRRGVPPAPVEGTPALPAAFYSFANPQAGPQFPLDITFGGRLRLLGYDVIPEEQFRRTGFRFYWQALEPLPADLELRIFAVTPDGEEVDSTDQRPLMQALWRPPADWPVGEVVVTDKLPWYLPRQWALGVGAYQGEAWSEQGSRWPALADPAAQGVDTATFDDSTWVRLNPWQWRRGRLITPPTPPAIMPAAHTFGGDGWIVTLTGMDEPARAAPGQEVPVTLQWEAQTAAPRDYTVFVHLRDVAGNVVAQADATPHYYGSLPTSRWPLAEPVLDAHTLPLPANLPPGVYDLVVGWYYWETQERLALLDHNNIPAGDGAVVAQMEVDTTAGPTPDLCCALVPECCASQ